MSRSYTLVKHHQYQTLSFPASFSISLKSHIQDIAHYIGHHCVISKQCTIFSIYHLPLIRSSHRWGSPFTHSLTCFISNTDQSSSKTSLYWPVFIPSPRSCMYPRLNIACALCCCSEAILLVSGCCLVVYHCAVTIVMVVTYLHTSHSVACQFINRNTGCQLSLRITIDFKCSKLHSSFHMQTQRGGKDMDLTDKWWAAGFAACSSLQPLCMRIFSFLHFFYIAIYSQVKR